MPPDLAFGQEIAAVMSLLSPKNAPKAKFEMFADTTAPVPSMPKELSPLNAMNTALEKDDQFQAGVVITSPVFAHAQMVTSLKSTLPVLNTALIHYKILPFVDKLIPTNGVQLEKNGTLVALLAH